LDFQSSIFDLRSSIFNLLGLPEAAQVEHVAHLMDFGFWVLDFRSSIFDLQSSIFNLQSSIF